MSSILKLPIKDRIRLVGDIWDSIAADQSALDLTEAQRTELDKRLDDFEKDGKIG
jgi:putative addiction module component (TIGR02574 family)